MKIGFLFPGQGSQTVGMGKDLYVKYEPYRNVYEKVKDITGIDIADITFNENDGKLNETKYTQICILTMSLAILAILKENNIKADISAGLSLGEYTALMYSNLFSFEDGVKIVQKRGEYMQDLVPNGKWSMAAILGLEDEKVETACRKAKSGFVVPVNYNCIGQVVISGEDIAVEEAGKIAKELGAKKVRILNTSGPFHTEKLEESSIALGNELEKYSFNKCDSKVVKNLDGEFYSEGDNYLEILKKHIVSPVKFSKVLETMMENGIDTFIEIGPGKTLSGFVKRMAGERTINILNICDEASLENVINFINSKD